MSSPQHDTPTPTADLARDLVVRKRRSEKVTIEWHALASRPYFDDNTVRFRR
jgi:hypothetical protein